MKGKSLAIDWMKIGIFILTLLGLGIYNWQIYAFSTGFGLLDFIINLIWIGVVILIVKTMNDKSKIKVYQLEIYANILINITILFWAIFGDLKVYLTLMIFVINGALCWFFTAWMNEAKERVKKDTSSNLGEWAGLLLGWIRCTDKMWEDRDQDSVLRSLTHSIQIAAALMNDPQYLPQGVSYHIESILRDLRNARKTYFSSSEDGQPAALNILENLDGRLGKILKVVPFEGEMPSEEI